MTGPEVLVALAVVAIVTALAVPELVQRLTEAKVRRAIVDLRSLGDQVEIYASELGAWPATLEDLSRPVPLDPWGSPYRYLSSSDRTWRGESRRDRFLVPLNSDYDLYSNGADGQSEAPLTAKASRDDIVRADDGGYYGPARDF
jgi:general secretion pathway protein G